ncbi:hypothetical protein ATKI12_3515 [Kitasatospora sp. Ki12]
MLGARFVGGHARRRPSSVRSSPTSGSCDHSRPPPPGTTKRPVVPARSGGRS